MKKLIKKFWHWLYKKALEGGYWGEHTSGFLVDHKMDESFIKNMSHRCKASLLDHMVNRKILLLVEHSREDYSMCAQRYDFLLTLPLVKQPQNEVGEESNPKRVGIDP